MEEHFLLVEKLPLIFGGMYGAIPEKIFIRQCYLDLYERAADLMFSGEMERGVTLFHGTPGIGKSLFLIYFLFRYLHDDRFPDKRFALESDSGQYAYYEAVDPAEAEDFSCFHLDDAKILHNVLVLCDIRTLTGPALRTKYVFIFSPPDPLRYKETMKYEPHFRFTMPTWSKEELEAVNPNTESWAERFETFGGVPRLVFSSDPRMRDLEGIPLTEQNLLIAEKFLKGELSSTDSLQNSLLVHVNPPKLANGNIKYDGLEEHSLASSYIHNTLRYSRITFYMIDEAKGVFNSGRGLQKYGAHSARRLFERMCVYLEPITELSFTATSLSTGEPSASFTIPRETFLLLSGWEELKQLPINMLITPYNSEFESADAFYAVEDSPNSFQLVVLQFTVGEESHPVNINGLVNIVSGFPEPVRSNINGLKIVFIAPAKGPYLRKKQELITLKGKQYPAEMIPDIMKDSQQFLYKHRF